MVVVVDARGRWKPPSRGSGSDCPAAAGGPRLHSGHRPGGGGCLRCGTAPGRDPDRERELRGPGRGPAGEEVPRGRRPHPAGPAAIQRGYVYFSEVPDLPVEDMAAMERLW